MTLSPQLAVQFSQTDELLESQLVQQVGLQNKSDLIEDALSEIREHILACTAQITGIYEKIGEVATPYRQVASELTRLVSQKKHLLKKQEILQSRANTLSSLHSNTELSPAEFLRLKARLGDPEALRKTIAYLVRDLEAVNLAEAFSGVDVIPPGSDQESYNNYKKRLPYIRAAGYLDPQADHKSVRDRIVQQLVDFVGAEVDTKTLTESEKVDSSAALTSLVQHLAEIDAKISSLLQEKTGAFEQLRSTSPQQAQALQSAEEQRQLWQEQLQDMQKELNLIKNNLQALESEIGAEQRQKDNLQTRLLQTIIV